jgi:imidazolonepropionase-like amidohydrolase
MKRLLTFSIAIVALAVTLAVHAEAPNVFVIRGARIVTAAGAAIESGTLVIRRGVIEAVGANVSVPAEADVIDGKGLTVYPGLIDLGNTQVADQPIPQQPQGVRTTADLERWKREQILKPQFRAVEAVKVDDPMMTRLAAAGVTSALALPSGDVITGQSALINVAGVPDQPQIGNIVEPRRGLVVLKTPVALHVSFPGRPRAGGGAYPESLMGVIAFVRQSFLDAQHYHDVAAHAAAKHDAVESTPDSPSLEAMQPAIERKEPVAFEANQAREILRVLKLARELNLDPIVTGARDAEEVAADLKSQNARVIYSLNYPTRSRALAPEADEPARVLRERANATRVPQSLARAGVPFAFESAGLDQAKDFVKNAAKAVKAGLADDAAVRALTIDAATIAGVGDRLGTLENGKIANLILTDGNLFDEKTSVKRVFIEGRPVSLDVPPAPGGGRGRGRGE